MRFGVETAVGFVNCDVHGVDAVLMSRIKQLLEILRNDFLAFERMLL